MTDREYILTSIDDIKKVTGYVFSKIEGYKALGEAKKYEIKLVINELLVNCFKYSAPSKDTPVILEAHVQDGKLVVRKSEELRSPTGAGIPGWCCGLP